ncbi:UNKNOWN [Stylonychia lemnae]|uniref:Kelch motif family protein n=1 Tax=Stylonychia lemnae TaxID=5949 RepID=A0A078B5H6_STYLE|nr:UNKNOWN [Stylonychia lemnae]|eukprot:CDW89451.1 UNKNOWN [Stylonychia lemnae]
MPKEVPRVQTVQNPQNPSISTIASKINSKRVMPLPKEIVQEKPQEQQQQIQKITQNSENKSVSNPLPTNQKTSSSKQNEENEKAELPKAKTDKASITPKKQTVQIQQDEQLETMQKQLQSIDPKVKTITPIKQSTQKNKQSMIKREGEFDFEEFQQFCQENLSKKRVKVAKTDIQANEFSTPIQKLGSSNSDDPFNSSDDDEKTFDQVKLTKDQLKEFDRITKKQSKPVKKPNIDAFSTKSQLIKGKKAIKKQQKKREAKKAIKEASKAKQVVQDSSSDEGEAVPITEFEMINALFYFEDRKQLKMVHLDRTKPLYKCQEKFFRDSPYIKKVKDGFGILHAEVMNNLSKQQEIRHLIFGTLPKCKDIHEFVRDEDIEKHVFEFAQGKFPYRSSKLIYNGNQLIITGGDYDIKDIATSLTYRFNIDIDEQKNLVKLTQDQSFPRLSKPRTQHLSFILQDFLFIMFGSESATVEYIDLKDPNATFKTLTLGNYQELQNPMIFFHEHSKQDMRPYVLGGIQVTKKSQDKVTKIQEIQIDFQVDIQNPQYRKVPKTIKLADQPLAQLEGTYQFEQNIPNKLYYEQQKTWMFLDQNGYLLSFDMMTKQFKVHYIKGI